MLILVGVVVEVKRLVNVLLDPFTPKRVQLLLQDTLDLLFELLLVALLGYLVLPLLSLVSRTGNLPDLESDPTDLNDVSLV